MVVYLYNICYFYVGIAFMDEKFLSYRVLLQWNLCSIVTSKSKCKSEPYLIQLQLQVIEQICLSMEQLSIAITQHCSEHFQTRTYTFLNVKIIFNFLQII